MFSYKQNNFSDLSLAFLGNEALPKSESAFLEKNLFLLATRRANSFL